jgi:hypothetical protein
MTDGRPPNALAATLAGAIKENDHENAVFQHVSQ